MHVFVPQGPPPTLEAESEGRHFSRSMREVVASCLNKDPAKRPTAKTLLSKGWVAGGAAGAAVDVSRAQPCAHCFCQEERAEPGVMHVTV